MYLRLPRFLAPQWVKSHPNLTHCQFCGQIYTYSTNYFKTQIGNKHFQNFLSSQYGNYRMDLCPRCEKTTDNLHQNK